MKFVFRDRVFLRMAINFALLLLLYQRFDNIESIGNMFVLLPAQLLKNRDIRNLKCYYCRIDHTKRSFLGKR